MHYINRTVLWRKLWSAPPTQFLQTERLLDNRRHSASGDGDASQDSDWPTQPTTPAELSDIRLESAVYSSRSENPLVRVSKINRTLQARVKVRRYGIAALLTRDRLRCSRLISGCVKDRRCLKRRSDPETLVLIFRKAASVHPEDMEMCLSARCHLMVNIDRRGWLPARLICGSH